MNLSENARVGVGFIVGLALGVGGTVGVTKAQELNPFGNDLMANVEVVDKARPIVFTPDLVMQRLDLNTDRDWGLVMHQDFGAHYGGAPLASDKEYLRDLGEHVTVPPLKQARVTGVFTNVFDEASVAGNGTLYMVWFTQYPDARRWLMQDPVIFTDAREEKERETFQVGKLVVYYAPPEGAGGDETKAIQTWLREVALCPNDAGLCPLPASQ